MIALGGRTVLRLVLRTQPRSPTLRGSGVRLPWAESFRSKGCLQDRWGSEGYERIFRYFPLFPIFCFARRTQRKTGAKMKAQRRKKPGSDMNDRFGQVSGRVRREGGFESGAQRRTPRRWRVGGYSGASWRDRLAGVAAPGLLDTGAGRRNPDLSMSERCSGNVSGGWAGGFESGAARRTPRRWRVGGCSGTSWRDGLAGVAAPGPLDTGALRERGEPADRKGFGAAPQKKARCRMRVPKRSKNVLLRDGRAGERWILCAFCQIDFASTKGGS